MAQTTRYAALTAHLRRCRMGPDPVSPGSTRNPRRPSRRYPTGGGGFPKESIPRTVVSPVRRYLGVPVVLVTVDLCGWSGWIPAREPSLVILLVKWIHSLMRVTAWPYSFSKASGTPAGVKPVRRERKRTISGAITLLLFAILAHGVVGCSASSDRSVSSFASSRASSGVTSGSSRAAHISPAQHARAQVQWLRARSGQLSDQQLYLLQQIPWNSGSAVDQARQRMLQRGRDGASVEQEYGSQRILGRPRVMDSARDQLRTRETRTEQTRTEQNRTEETRTEQNRTGNPAEEAGAS